mmetsp:Transcript_104709/g.208033  ORF Transcript_104709/g.208033 Transcript_104709/m.208033 type:complete len:162 (+) Transcript_104709:63-548(+)
MAIKIMPGDAKPVPSQDASREHKPKKASRFASAVKQTAERLYRSASNLMPGASIHGVDGEAGKLRGSTQGAPNDRKAKHSTKHAGGPGFNGLLPERSPVERNSRRRSRANRQHVQHIIRREQLRRGRPLTAEEQQMVIDFVTLRNKRLDLGLDSFGFEENY